MRSKYLASLLGLCTAFALLRTNAFMISSSQPRACSRGQSASHLIPSRRCRRISYARPACRQPNRAGRLYMGRLTERPGDKQDKEKAEQGLPKNLEGEIPKLGRDQEEAVDRSMGVAPPAERELNMEEWEAQVEKRLQEMYEKGTYDPTPVNMKPQDLARQQWIDDFLNKEERPIGWDLKYWFGIWSQGDIRFTSVGRGLKSFGFAVMGITAIALLFLVEDEVLNPIADDYQRWDGNDFFHFTEDLGAWAAAVPHRVSDYFTHFSWQEWGNRVSARAGATPRWYQQLGLPIDNQGPASGPGGGPGS